MFVWFPARAELENSRMSLTKKEEKFYFKLRPCCVIQQGSRASKTSLPITRLLPPQLYNQCSPCPHTPRTFNCELVTPNTISISPRLLMTFRAAARTPSYYSPSILELLPKCRTTNFRNCKGSGQQRQKAVGKPVPNFWGSDNPADPNGPFLHRNVLLNSSP
ncbi:hypothetical protein CEXT_145621 [Caerostris extrusa]|uniref:Uncharacterized protein n=1 Tax=Caerostris extrusa TaxID=172846 RepID=A0AAV4WC28_CAEEX|nr:hypothetical protein CEXT_145621 [Caerostris extrusa]